MANFIRFKVKWRDFVICTEAGIAIERIALEPQIRNNAVKNLPKYIAVQVLKISKEDE